MSELTREKKCQIAAMAVKGKTRKEIMDITGLSQSAVYLLIPASKGDQKGKPHKKKEPAPAATDTDSMKNEIKTLSTTNDTTETAESQALKAAKKKLLEIYETLSPEETRAWEMGEVYAEIVRGCGE